MLDFNSECCITSPNATGPLAPQKKFKGVLFYVGVVVILVTWPDPAKNFHSPDPWRLHMQFGFNRPSDFGDVWKKLTNTEWTDERTDNPWNVQNFDVNRYSFSSWPIDASFIRKSKIDPEKSIVFHFFLYKSIRGQIWPCEKNRSSSTPGHHVNKLKWTHVPNAAYQDQWL